MPNVAPGLIAVVTSPISYYQLDASGNAVGDAISYAKGAVIHDEAEVRDLHDRHFHHALAPTAHHAHLCPPDCSVISPPAPSFSTSRSTSPEPISQSPQLPAASVEVK